MIETLAFDFGRVIGYFDHYRALGKLTAYSDMSEGDMFTAIFGGDLEDRFESGSMGEPEFLGRVRDLCRLSCDDGILAAAVADIFWPNEPLCALIPQLKQHYRVILGSNTNPIHSRRFLAQFAGTLQHFDALVLSHEVGARKPGRAFFDEVIRAGACEPARCVFVDDLPENIAGANANGLRGIVYSNFEGLLASLRELGVRID